jgi:hypothetical protein
MAPGGTTTPARAPTPTQANLGRWSGLSLAAGGTLATGAWVFYAIVDPGRGGYAEPWWIPLNLALSVGAILMAFGLPGFHARQAARTGAPGLLGVALFFSGMLLAYVGVQTLEAFSQPQVPASIAILAGIAAPMFFVGIVLTSVVTWRAGVYPRAAAAVLALSALLGLMTRLVAMPDWLGMAIVPAVFTGTVAWLGIELVRAGRDRVAAR